MTRLRGWAPRGHKLLAKVPHGHWRTLTFLAALRHDRLTAPCVFDGPINGESFRAYVEQMLVPTLKLFFLPPYSPDLNPIEQVFAKLKTLLRKADERTVNATTERIGTLLKSITSDECANYLRNAGYASV